MGVFPASHGSFRGIFKKTAFLGRKFFFLFKTFIFLHGGFHERFSLGACTCFLTGAFQVNIVLTCFSLLTASIICSCVL